MPLDDVSVDAFLTTLGMVGDDAPRMVLVVVGVAIRAFVHTIVEFFCGTVLLGVSNIFVDVIGSTFGMTAVKVLADVGFTDEFIHVEVCGVTVREDDALDDGIVTNRRLVTRDDTVTTVDWLVAGTKVVDGTGEKGLLDDGTEGYIF